MKHDLYQPERYEGCSACRICGGFEGTLTRECPGRKTTNDEQDAIYAGKIDFRGGAWVNEPSGLVASHHSKEPGQNCECKREPHALWCSYITKV
jgi:hypothetical protein